jgi:hypothetical protein
LDFYLYAKDVFYPTNYKNNCNEEEKIFKKTLKLQFKKVMKWIFNSLNYPILLRFVYLDTVNLKARNQFKIPNFMRTTAVVDQMDKSCIPTAYITSNSKYIYDGFDGEKVRLKSLRDPTIQNNLEKHHFNDYYLEKTSFEVLLKELT